MTTATPTTGTIKQISYVIPSHSEPGIVRTVQVNPYTLRPTSCDCPARRECWHMKMIASGKCALKPRVRFGPGRPLSATISDLYGD
jgi:hypothetical protein